MKPRMPMYTDDHTIMITAEFWENGYLLKNGQSRIQRFEVDLLVRQDMTLDRLLDALGRGIEKKLEEKYGIISPEEEVQLLYRDQAYYGRSGLWQNVDEFVETDPSCRRSPLPPEAQNRHNWLVCWKLLRDCCEEYRRGYVETRDSDRAAVFPAGVPRHPVVACGSIDLGIWDQAELTRMTHVSQIWLDRDHHGNRTLRELGFVTSTRLIFDPAMWHRADTLFGEALPSKPSNTGYRVGNVPMISVDKEPIRILAPKIPVPKIRPSLIPTIMAPLLTMAILFGIASVGGRPFQMEWMFPFLGTMLLATGLLGLLGWWVSRRAMRMEIKLRCTQYEGYAREMLTKIKQRQEDYVEYLTRQHPPALDPVCKKDLIHMAAPGKGAMFSRSPAHQEYLKVRVGLSLPNTRLVPSPFRIRADEVSTAFHGYRYINIESTVLRPFQILPGAGPARNDRKGVVGGGYLEHFPEDVSRAYAYLSNAPVLLDFYRSRAIGILFQDTQASHRPFLANLLLDLCFHHSPDRLQIVMLLKPADDPHQQQEAIRYYKHLPHFRQFLTDHSPFAFNMHQAGFVMDRVQDHMVRCRMNPGGTYPHILVIAEESDWLFAHPLSGWLPGDNGEIADSGLTFLVCSHFARDLPRNCDAMIKVTPDGEYFLLPNSRTVENDSERLFAFCPDALPYHRSNYGTQDEKDLYFRAYKTLSAICAKRNRGIPMTDFLELMDGYSRRQGCTARFLLDHEGDEGAYQEKLNGELAKYLKFLSEKRSLAPLDSLCVPVGFDHSGLVTLDLHPSRQGPHLLILADQGMGKTQFLLTYLNSLCMHYTPAQLQLILLDPLSDGIAEKLRLSKLAQRHMNTVYSFPPRTSFDQDINVGLNLLNNLKQEISDRRILFARLRISRESGGFCRIDAYNQAVRNVTRYAVENLKLHDEELTLWLRQNADHRQLPHLFVVLDNYTQLMEFAQMNDRAEQLFVSQLSDILKQGADYGIHVIVAAQSLEYGMPDGLRRGFQSRICFRVEDRKAAMELVGTEVPAGPHFPENGYAYLRCAADGTFGEFQVSYSGDHPLYRAVQPFRLAYLPFGGPYELMFESNPSGESMKEYGTEYDTRRNRHQEHDSVWNVYHDRPRSRPVQPSQTASGSGRRTPRMDSWPPTDDVTVRDEELVRSQSRPVQPSPAAAGSGRRTPRMDSWPPADDVTVRDEELVRSQTRPVQPSPAAAGTAGRMPKMDTWQDSE